MTGLGSRREHRVDSSAGYWFLSGAERGNAATDVHTGSAGSPSWSEGNLVRPLIHGATYFARLHEELSALQAGDRVWFTDWRGDGDERLTADGPTIGELLARLARAGVEVRGLIWRSHGERVSAPMSNRSNELLSRQINDAGGEVLLDQRVRLFGCHHQKLFVIRSRDDPSRDVAFVGGIDLSHSRRDDADHAGDPQAVDMDPRYGKQPPWHDAALELRGPVVADVLELFAERWNDPHPLDHRTPYRMLLQRLADMPRHPEPLPETAPPPPPAGPHAVQLLRTYGVKHPPFPFAPDGERSVARAYTKAFALARSLIYIEDQYLWSAEVAAGIAAALEQNPGLNVIAVVPRYPDSDGPLGRAAQAARATACHRNDKPRGTRQIRRVQSGEQSRDSDLRPRQDLHHRRHLVHVRVGQLQPSVLDHGQRAYLRGHRHHCRSGSTGAHWSRSRWPRSSGSNSGPNTWAWTRVTPGSRPRRPGSACGMPPPTPWTIGTKPAAARPAPRDMCGTTDGTRDTLSAPLGGSGKPVSGGPGRPPPEDARHHPVLGKHFEPRWGRR